MRILKNKKIILTFLFLAIAFFASVNFVFAQNFGMEYASTLGIGTQGLKVTLSKIINAALGFLGVLAISLIIYGGFVWMTSGGIPERVNKAKKILINAVIGLAIVLLSYVIVQFVIKTITGGNGNVSGTPCDCATELGNCASAGCSMCQNTATPNVCTWQNDASLTCPGCVSGPNNFILESIQPPNAICPITATNTTIRNAVIRMYFNKDVDSGSVNASSIIIQGSNTQCPSGALAPISGTFSVSGKMVEFRPDIGTCPSNPCNADRCFGADSTIDINVVVGAGGVTTGGGALTLEDNLSFDEHSQFFTNSLIDCQKPTVDLLSQDQICLDTDNNLGAESSDDSGVPHVIFSDDNGDSAFLPLGGPITVFCPGPGICGNPTPWIIPQGTVVWHPGIGYIAGTQYTIKAEAYDFDDNNADDSRKFTLREAHCCNTIQDFDEEGIDCGGMDCARCAGSACGNDIFTSCAGPSCAPNNDLCASNFCDCTPDIAGICLSAGYSVGVDPCCICQQTPVIDCITPNSTDSCNPHGTPLGTEGNLITIWGRHFGTYVPGLSLVTINAIPSDLAQTVNALCVDSWTDTQIVVVVPNGANNGVIEVTNSAGYSDATNDTRGTIIPNFNDDGVVRPSICLVENFEPSSSCFGNACGFFNDTVRGQGINIMAGSTVEFGNDKSNEAGINSVPVPDLSISCQVPNLKSGKTGFRVVSASKEYSNYLNFTIRSLSDTGPHIDYLEPDMGPEGQYVTIYGSGFGSSPAGSLVTFNSVPADFSFPPECAVGDYWRNNYIIAKVPATSDGDVVVTVKGETSNAVPFDFCVVGIDPNCELLPGMCRLSPSSGPVLTTFTDINGDHFGDILGNVRFFNNQLSLNVSNWTNTSARSQVPAGAETGPVRVVSFSGLQSSNSIPFAVGDCDGDDANCPLGTICCPNGACYVGSCPVPNFSTYTWTFTTGNYFVIEKCDTEKPYYEDPVIPSPTPWSKRGGGENVCINAAIGASFSEPVLLTSINPANVLINICSGPASNPCSILGPVAGVLTPILDSTATYAEAFRFEPGTFLNQNTWYQAKLRGGAGGITTTSNIPLVDDYIWYFKTRNNDTQCEIGKVKVLPNPAKLVDINSTQDFVAIPIPKDNPCIILNGSLYNWTWESTDISVATLLGNVTANETATPHNNGKTNIKATVLPDNIVGQAVLTVDLQGLNIIDHWYECDAVCVNAELGIRFDKQVDLTTLTNNNINIYNCGNNANCPIDTSSVPILITNPAANYIWNNVTGDSIATFSSAFGNFSADTYYRVVITGGKDGVKNTLGDTILNLNSNLAFGEECDSAFNPLCSSANCLLQGNVCGTDYQECEAGTLGCNANCLHTGSVLSSCGDGIINGSGKENCDYNGICVDSVTDIALGPPYQFCRTSVSDCGLGHYCKFVSDNGCNANCLLTGSTNTAICGNGIIEFGEACDDHNQTNNDGCNNHCLNESETATGVPGSICGDGKIGIGEDCDDGNNISGDGCSNICLNEGSGGLAICGDGIVEDNKNDFFSWIFKTKEPPDDLCALSQVEVIPSMTTASTGNTVDYRSVAKSSPDNCDFSGQTLNPWNYNWAWNSDDPVVADLVWPLQDTGPSAPDGNIDPYQNVNTNNVGTTNINAIANTISGSGIITVKEPAPPGTPCEIDSSNCCNYGVHSCGLGFECITDSSLCSPDVGNPPFDFTNNCRCCCNPLDDQCPSPLSCHPGISPCTMCDPAVSTCSNPIIERGLCCGCEDDSDCAPLGPNLFCGNDTCCHAAPNVVPPTMPANNESNVCRNVLISADFDQPMDVNTFSNNIEVVGNYTIEGACPAGTFAPKIFTFPATETWCAIDGRVFVREDTMGNSVINFASENVLEPLKAYNVIINYEVENVYGINMGIDYIWKFTTGKDVCDIDYIRVDLETGNAPNPNMIYEDLNSDLFLCAGRDDCKRDALDDVGDPVGNQHILTAIPVDDITGNLLNPDNFDWTWEEDDSTDIFEIPLSIPLDQNIINITSHPLNGKSRLKIKADSNSSVEFGNSLKWFGINVFLCENPWPSIEYWPWEDNRLDNATANCDIGTATCDDTYFNLFYCRDAGKPGIEDDLPKISSDPLVFSESGKISKELFFIEDKHENGGPNINTLNSSVTPCTGSLGTVFNVTAEIVDVDGIADGTGIYPAPTAYIQTPDENNIDSVVLTDPDNNNIFEGNWTDNICVGHCSYYVDIIVYDKLGNMTEAENIKCLNPCVDSDECTLFGGEVGCRTIGTVPDHTSVIPGVNCCEGNCYTCNYGYNWNSVEQECKKTCIDTATCNLAGGDVGCTALMPSNAHIVQGVDCCAGNCYQCNNGFSWNGTICESSCSNECSEGSIGCCDGAGGCSGYDNTWRWICRLQVDSCYHKYPYENCADLSRTCSAGVCESSACVDECSPGLSDSGCDGAQRWECEIQGVDGCYDKINKENCADQGKVCRMKSSSESDCCSDLCDPSTDPPKCNFGNTGVEACQTQADGCYDRSTSEICQNGETCVNGSCVGGCVPNGCNGNCPSGCTVAQDPDCGCQDGNGCCGEGCNSSNDNDCGGSCNSNGICESGENCLNCPADCGACPVTCPDGFCDEGCGECSSCPADCYCGNGNCDCGETSSTCLADCGGGCTNDCPSSGSTQCSGIQIQTCGNYDADSCLEWSSPQNCPVGQTCSGGACVAGCTDECSWSGQKQCSGIQIQTCGNYDADSCLEWSSPQNCPTGQTCSGGACVAGCTDECSWSGQKQCSGVQIQTCGNYDADSCLEWSSPQNCPTGQTCSGGACVNTCTPNCSTCGGCRANNPGNASPSAAECCGTGTCYACDTGRTWNGNSCVWGQAPTNMTYTINEAVYDSDTGWYEFWADCNAGTNMQTWNWSANYVDTYEWTFCIMGNSSNSCGYFGDGSSSDWETWMDLTITSPYSINWGDGTIVLNNPDNPALVGFKIRACNTVGCTESKPIYGGVDNCW